MSAVLVTIWGYLTYIIIIEGAPIIVYILMPVLIAAGFGLLASLIYSLVKTPSWIKRFEQKYFGEN
jgi:hypothetical protein